MTDSLPPIAEGLLAPLLDDAAATLRSLEPADIPHSLRALAGFDSRGLARGAARRQLLRAFEHDSEFQARVVERFARRTEIETLTAAWSVDSALRIVEAAPETALPQVVSMLFALRPAGWAFALGAACESAARATRRRSTDDEARRRAAELATTAEAIRRADAAREAAERERERLDRELRSERQTRRDKERDAAGALDEARRREATASAELEEVRATLATAEARARREVDRAARLERELRAAHAARASAPTGVDPQSLLDAANDAHELGARLEELAAEASAERAGPSPPPVTSGASPSTTPPSRPRRVRPTCPPGLLADTRAGLDGMLRTRGVVLVVDGYNVSKTAWPDASLEEQRERLVAALAEFHLRIRCEVVVAFDGAGLRGAPSARRPGVRVVFSEPGETADDVVVREAGVQPRTVPVVVASSDNDVRDRAAREGAVVVGSSVLLTVLRR